VFGGSFAVGAAGVAIVSRAALVPVRRLTGTAERIAETGEPSERVPVNGRDELSRLGGAFNTMLGALEESLETQRRFVADASHELRTPLTSMQTNIEVLKQQERLDPDARARLYADLERESHEMRDLIAGLLELARGDDAGLERTTVHLDDVVESAVSRARARFPELTWASRIEPTTIEGVPERLERAAWNLLENAGKWSRDGSSVDVMLADGELVVRDHGPGIAEEDREHVFDRFYRAPAARSLPGSGLGLAIVWEIAEAHGATVTAEEAPGGGALLRLRLPTPPNS
jgi:two-component system, OmpR family, sensor histidine kinase MprB